MRAVPFAGAGFAEKLGLRQLFHVAAVPTSIRVGTPWPPKESTPSRARLQKIETPKGSRWKIFHANQNIPTHGRFDGGAGGSVGASFSNGIAGAACGAVA